MFREGLKHVPAPSAKPLCGANCLCVGKHAVTPAAHIAVFHLIRVALAFAPPQSSRGLRLAFRLNTLKAHGHGSKPMGSHFGIGAALTFVYSSGDWDVH